MGMRETATLGGHAMTDKCHGEHTVSVMANANAKANPNAIPNTYRKDASLQMSKQKKKTEFKKAFSLRTHAVLHD